jgi:hypothetical protein
VTTLTVLAKTVTVEVTALVKIADRLFQKAKPLSFERLTFLFLVNLAFVGI